MLRIHRSLALPESELTERFVRAAGPGGQHVNRTDSAVELRFDAARSPSLPESLRVRLLARHDRRITRDGVIVIQARRFRDQVRNREDARARLIELLRSAMHTAPRRIPTRPTRASKQRRLEAKQQRSRIKRARSADWNRE